MFLTVEPALLIAAIFGLPLVAVLGAACTSATWVAGRAHGGRAVAWAWLATSLLGVGGLLAFSCWQTREWGACFGTMRDLLEETALLTLLIGSCLAAPAWMIRRRLAAGARLDIEGVLGGAAAAIGVWVALFAIAIVANRVVG
jgi:hypothetical protein